MCDEACPFLLLALVHANGCCKAGALGDTSTAPAPTLHQVSQCGHVRSALEMLTAECKKGSGHFQ